MHEKMRPDGVKIFVSSSWSDSLKIKEKDLPLWDTVKGKNHSGMSSYYIESLKLVGNSIEQVNANNIRLVKYILSSWERREDSVSFLDSWESWLNLVLEPKYADALLGDMRERFEDKLLPKYGFKYARRWYRSQILRLFVVFLVRKAKWLLGLAFMNEIFSRLMAK